MSKWSIGAAWVVVAALATTLTWQIVSAADAQVSDRSPLQVDAPLSGSTEATTTTQGRVTNTSAQRPTSTTTTTSPVSSTSTAPEPSSTTTAGAEEPSGTQTIPTGGGVVVVRYRPGEVELTSATPAAGFAAEIKKPGPPDVDVEFESALAKFRVRAKWVDGGLSIETDVDA